MPEPIAVAFVEVLPEFTGFRAATQAELTKTAAAAKFTVPPLAGAGAVAGQLKTVTVAADEAVTAETLLLEAQAKLDAALTAGSGVEGRAAKAHLERAAAAEADAAAQRALFAITDETASATVGEIDALVTATGTLNAKAAAEERAAFATGTHAKASGEAADAILAETATMTGLRGASIGVNPAFLAATAGAIAFFKSAEQAAQFEEAMHRIEFATHASDEELKTISHTARQLGSDLTIPGASANDAAEAIAELVNSGKSLAEASQLARPVLVLQAAAQLDNATAVRTTVQILNAYNLSAADATDVTDALTVATKSGAGSADDYASALAAVAPVANTFGLDVRETTGLLIQLSQGGVAASQTGTLLRQSLLKLANPTAAARKELKQLGLSVKDLLDSQGNLRPDAFVRLGEAIDGLSRAQQRAALTQIFSLRGVRAVLPLTEAGRAGFQAAQAQADQYGVALDEAKAREQGLTGQGRELKKNLQDIGLTLGNATVPAIEDFTGAVNASLQPTESFIEKIQRLTGESGGLPKALDNAVKVIKGTLEGKTLKFGTLQFVTPDETEAERKRLTQLRTDVADLFGEFRKAGRGITARNELVLALQAIREKLDETTPAGQQAIKQIDGVIKKVQEGGKLPPIPISFGVTFDPGEIDSKTKDAGDRLRNSFITTAQEGFPALAQVGLDMTNALLSGADKADVEGKGKDVVRRFSLGAQLAVAKATGTPGDQLDILRQQQARESAALQRKTAAFKAGKVNEQAVTNQANQLDSTNAAIASILSEQKSKTEAAAADAKAKAAKIKSAAEARDQAFLDAINSEQTRREARVSAAGSTAALGDDVKANAALRDFLREAIESVRARLRQAREAGHATKGLKDELQTLRLAKAEVRREIQRLRQDAREQADQTRIESAQLDEQLLETRFGSTDKLTTRQIDLEVAAHKRIIAALKIAQSHTKKGTVEWKRLRNEIAAENAAIEEVRKTKDKGDKEALGLKRQEFAFLQTLSGFAANLITNTLPGGTGLVGGTTPNVPTATTRPQVPVNRATPRTPAAGVTTRPVSSGQGNIQIDLLRKILGELKNGRQGPQHPEAHAQRRRGSAAGDYSYQGTHGM